MVRPCDEEGRDWEKCKVRKCQRKKKREDKPTVKKRKEMHDNCRGERGRYNIRASMEEQSEPFSW